ncbi:LCCL domain-containing protein [Plasmodium malariae]|uniref:LCCL domain-containing protein n=1 Tax=Plasmodium malariae TaxID=5858 RepID=A0A1C3L1L0_PLAMA|nr:LCCL domain-containing protein [Plasmodium malariae]
MYELEDEVDKNRKAFLENKKNCSVLKGYAVEDRADGLIGSYYDNAYFSGYPVSINTDKYINFIWDTGIPIENIPYQHFSVRWDGYLKIPQTGNYIITIEHDCGVRIFLDNSPIIVSNMPYPKEDESEEMRPISVLPIEKINAKVHKISSEKLGLIGGKDLSHAGISFLPLECKNNEACDTLNTWSIDLLHEGTYYISIEIGSPSGRQELNSIKVNGEVFINNIFLKPKQYTKVSAEVNITKNKIVQISTNTNTVIQSVQLLFLHN